MIADSCAHAWSTGPTPAMSQYILGVAPATPGFATWTIAPHLGDLRWAQGVVPTPHGPISVRWQRNNSDHDHDTDSFVLTVWAPVRTSGAVEIPLLDRKGTIARNGKIVWTRGRAARHVHAHRVGTSAALVQAAGRATYASVR